MLVQGISIILLCAAALPMTACARGANVAGVTEFAAQAAPEGTSLRGRVEAALREARSGGANRVWTVYRIRARKGIRLDGDLPQALKGKVMLRGLRVERNSPMPSANVGVFLQHDLSGNSLEAVEIHDLDRYRPESDVPVRQLGDAENGESLALLNAMYERRPGGQVGERMVMVMALHDSPEVGPLLKNILAGNYEEKERAQAVLWLGEVPGQKSFLESLARDVRLGSEVRKQAVVSIGFSQSPGALATLRGLYETIPEREIKEQCLFAASVNGDKRGATAFLREVKANDPNPDMRRQAATWLDRISGTDDF